MLNVALLQQLLKDALDKQSAKTEGSSPEESRTELAKDLAYAINEFVKTSQVTLAQGTVTVTDGTSISTNPTPITGIII